MSEFKEWLKSWLTMSRKQCLFVDQVSGDEVFLYVDCYGQEWMANYFYFGFRIKKQMKGEGDA